MPSADSRNAIEQMGVKQRLRAQCASGATPSSEMPRYATTRAAHDARQAALFNCIADEFLKPQPGSVLARLASIVAKASVRPGHAILDVGTGTGALLPHILRRRPGSIVACDLSEEMLRRARDQFGEQVVFVQADVVDLPAALGPFDRVFCNAVFGNLYDQPQAMATFHRLLKPRGRVVISHPMGRSFVHALHGSNPEVVLHELPTARQLDRFCVNAGFRVLHFVDEPNLYIAVIQRVALSMPR